jgi:DNA-binding transcriptional LysR family regulator
MRMDDPKLDAVRLHREDYALVGQPALLRRTPLRRPADAANHTLLDERSALPLYAYWRDSAGGRDSLAFGRFVYLGTTAAIRAGVLAGDGIAVLPRYLINPDLATGRLTPILPRVKPLHDFFRLIFRSDDPRRSLYQAIATTMASQPLR